MAPRDSAPGGADARQLVVLAFLRDAAVRGDGWERRGVRGWFFSEEIAALTGQWVGGLLLFHLGRTGFVDRLDVGAGLHRKPFLLYRIRPEAAAALGGAAVEPPGTDDDHAGNLYLPRHAWTVSDALSRRLLSGLGVVRFGQPGWMNGAELHAATNSHFSSHGIPWLQHRNLVLVRREAAAGRTRPESFYRVHPVLAGALVVEAVPMFRHRELWHWVEVKPAPFAE